MNSRDPPLINLAPSPRSHVSARPQSSAMTEPNTVASSSSVCARTAAALSSGAAARSLNATCKIPPANRELQKYCELEPCSSKMGLRPSSAARFAVVRPARPPPMMTISPLTQPSPYCGNNISAMIWVSSAKVRKANPRPTPAEIAVMPQTQCQPAKTMPSATKNGNAKPTKIDSLRPRVPMN